MLLEFITTWLGLSGGTEGRALAEGTIGLLDRLLAVDTLPVVDQLLTR